MWLYISIIKFPHSEKSLKKAPACCLSDFTPTPSGLIFCCSLSISKHKWSLSLVLVYDVLYSLHGEQCL